MELREQRLVHLDRLADELDKREFCAELTRAIAKPYLTVANAAQPQLNERVLCERADDGSWSFWWPWQQPIGSVDDLETVIGKIGSVLRTVEEADG
jgi:hypothetical protein